MSSTWDFFSELKRRNVYKVAVAYAVVSWLLIQAASILFPTFEAPPWVMKVFITLILFGFPIALVLSWAFELTPEGLKRAEDVRPEQSITKHTGRKIVALTIVFAVIAAGLLVFQLLRPRIATPAHAETSRAPAVNETAIPEKSIAVLPFNNLSDDKSNTYFVEGIQDEILTRLSKIADLKVISRSSTQKYKSAPDNLLDVGRQLGAAHLLEGSVQKVANAVLVNVQLIRVATDEHIWAESYNRKLDDVFAVEGEVASAIAEQLNARLTGAEAKAVAEKPTQNTAAYDAFLRGVSAETSGTMEAFKRAASDFAEAVRLDPQFGIAWARLAIARSSLFFNGIDPDENTATVIKELADRALSLAPNSGEAWVAQGVYRYRVLRDFRAALQSYQEALKRLPNSSLVLEQMAHVERRLGLWDDAEKHYRAAAELDPRSIDVLMSYAEVLQSHRRIDESIAVAERVLEMSPNNQQALATKAFGLQSDGRLNEAAKVLSEAPANPREGGLVLARVLQLCYERRFDDAISQIKESESPDVKFDARFIVLLGYCQYFGGHKDDARATFARAVAAIKPSPDSVVPVDARQLPCFLAWSYAGLEDKQKALEQAERAVQQYRDDGLSQPFALQVRAQVLAHFGDLDSAIATLDDLLKAPNGLTCATIRFDPFWDPVRKDPRFQKLCQEPK